MHKIVKIKKAQLLRLTYVGSKRRQSYNQVPVSSNYVR